MAMIKSALELALERTKDLTVDEAALEARALKQEGKKAAGRYLDDPESSDLAAALSSFAKDKRKAVREGMFESISAQLQLPTSEASLEAFPIIVKALSALALSPPGNGILGGVGGAMADKRVAALLQQLEGFFRQYLADMKNVEQAIRQQWGPKLREKERQLAARMGQDVRLDPMTDPEFAAFYKQNVSAVRQQYLDALDRAKADLAVLLGIEAK
jgi:hypothetical protein